jgi:hypothetical protein
MIWFQIITLLTVWTAVFLMALEVYAWLLRCAARFSRPLRLLLGVFAYLFIVGVYALPVFGFQPLLSPFMPSVTILYVAMHGILWCPGVAIVFFYHRHVPALQELGYFQPRT